MSFKCTLVAPDQQLFDGPINGAVLPAVDGQIGIKSDHAPILLRLGAGRLTLHRQNQSDLVLFVSGGVAQMKANVLTVLTDEACDPSTIDKQAARTELDALLATANPTDEDARTLRDRKIARARAMLSV
jgi:F-type H+-transporting ATPase subunit epsilon